jgi:hypothetical protein
MLIRGIGKNLKSEAWLGAAGYHRGSRRRQRSFIYGASDWFLTLVVVVCIYPHSPDDALILVAGFAIQI